MIITLLRIISALLGIVGTSFIVPLAAALACGETNAVLPFALPMAISWLCVLVFNLPFRKRTMNLTVRGTFVVVACAWIFTSLFGALPLYFSGAIPSFTDAVYESVSGFTTTGATILSDVESLPRSMNLWRCMTHWLGGMGIVALTVALLPLLGIGGFQLIKAETTGPEKGKVTPKIATTAKLLWIIYFAFTAIETVLLLLCRMDFIDSLSYAFATLGTGGFATRNASVGAYNSAAVDAVCTTFMFLAGVNFSLYYYALTREFAEIRHNSEFKVYLALIVFVVFALTASIKPLYGSFLTALRYSSFQTAAIITTTGFATADYTLWPPYAQFFILLLFFIGGSSGSTAGGVKVIRWVILFKQFGNEAKKMLHPHGVFAIRLNGAPGRKDVVFNVAAFLFVYGVLVLLTALAGSFAGLDLFSAFTGSLSMVGNVGPAFGALGPSCNYGFLPPLLKWWYCFAMLAGRLELYTMIIFFLPDYWRK